MANITSAGWATSNTSSDLPDTTFPQLASSHLPTTAQPEVPSPFEMLFSQQLATTSFGSGWTGLDNSQASEVNHVGTHNSSGLDSHALKLKSAVNADPTATNSLVTPQVATSSPILATLSVTAFSTSSTTVSLPSNTSSFQTGSNSVSATMTGAAVSVKVLTASKNDQSVPSIETANTDRTQSETEQSKTPSTALQDPAAAAVGPTAATTADVFESGLPTEAQNLPIQNELISKAATSEISSIGSELNSKPASSVFNPGRGVTVDDLQIERNSTTRNTTASPTSSTPRPTEQTVDPTSSESAIIPAMNLMSPTSETSDASISDQIATAVTGHLSDDSYQGPTTLRIRLNHSELGTVNLHLSMNNDVVSIRIVTQNPAAQQLINGQLEDLRQSLTNSGLATGQFQVACDAGSQHSSRQNESVPETIQFRNATSSRWARPQTTVTPTTQASGQLNFVA